MAKKRSGSKYQQKQLQGGKPKSEQKPGKPRVHRPKDVSDQEMAHRYETDMGENYTLVYLRRIAFPYYKVKVALIAAGKPAHDTEQVHSILLRLVKSGVNTEPTIREFLGLRPPYFVINELYALLREGALSPSMDGKYVITQKGEQILDGTAWLSITETTDYEFVIDGTTGALCQSRDLYTTTTETQLAGIFEGKRPSFKWLNDQWVELCALFQKENEGKELVDFSKNKQSIIWGEKFHEDHFVFGYAHKEDRNQEVQFLVRNLAEKPLDDKIPIVKELIGDLSDSLFDEDIADLVIEYESVFQEEREQIREEKAAIVPSAYRELKNFEVREEMLKAVRTAKTAILIESPWIRKATERLLPDLEHFLNRGGKVCILYGIDERDNHHAEILENLSMLKVRFSRQFYMVKLPDHFQNNFMDMSGTHRKILIKDTELTIKGSFNYLSNNSDSSEKFAAEEATLFFERSAERWRETFEEYRLAEGFLDFLKDTIP